MGIKFFDENGYLDMESIISHEAPFIFIWGGRGIGKTYGAIKYVIEHKIKHLFMRRTQTQLDIINRKEFSPYKDPLADMGIDFDIDTITKYNSGIYGVTEGEDGKIIANKSDLLGVTCALSTISNVRGFSARDIKVWLYDEFIPESHERPIKDEGNAFFNAYETINRNRELFGEPPVKIISMANSNNIACPLFMELEIVEDALKLEERGGNCYYYNKDRGMLLISIGESPISKAKSTTALYKLVGDNSSFRKMSILNSFNLAKKAPICNPQLRHLKPIVTLGELTIWEYKNSSKYICHITFALDKVVQHIEINDTNRKMIKNKYSIIWQQYLVGHVSFQKYMCEVLLQKYFK